MTKEHETILARRYPSEGASDDLCRTLGLQSWQIRYQAKRRGIRVDKAIARAKQLNYTQGMPTR